MWTVVEYDVCVTCVNFLSLGDMGLESLTINIIIGF